jgi:hypothetical protein
MSEFQKTRTAGERLRVANVQAVIRGLIIPFPTEARLSASNHYVPEHFDDTQPQLDFDPPPEAA